jgi:hypothetical protein
MSNLNGNGKDHVEASGEPKIPPGIDPRVAIIIDEMQQRTQWEQKRCLELRIINQSLVMRVQQLESELAAAKKELADPVSRKKGK